MSLTPEYLAEGAFFSAARAGAYLNDASLLLGHGSYTSALVLSVHGIEEIGRSRMCLEKAENALKGISIELESIRRFRRDAHIEKLDRGHSSPVTVLWWGEPVPGDAEEKFAAEELQKAKESRPKKTHETRLRKLNIDPDGATWGEPTTQDEASEMVGELAAEYSLLRNQLMRIAAEPGKFQAVASGIELPKLP